MSSGLTDLGQPQVMPRSIVSWSRLVRYVGHDGNIRYGEPVSEANDQDIAALAERGELHVHVCDGKTALTAQPTGQVEKAQKLLGPLQHAEVPIIRCIGLNYKTHSQ